jgi:hypothetical protein
MSAAELAVNGSGARLVPLSGGLPVTATGAGEEGQVE